MAYDPKSIRPRDGWVVVLDEPRKTLLSSGLFLPGAETGPEKVSEGAGILIRVGIGEKNRKIGLEPGLRVVYRGFLKYANPIETGEKWEDGQSKRYFVMSSDDLLFVVPDGVEVGVFSGRPQVPEKSMK